MGASTPSLSVARGNGKTALLSAVACATLDGPLMVPRSETLIVASSFGQATIAFEHVIAFMGDKLKDRQRWRVWQSGQLARIADKDTGATVKCLGSDPKRAHGLAPSLVLADEPAQWPTSTGDRMLAALRTAAGKQPDSRFVALGTRPAAHDHWFSRMLAGGADYAQAATFSRDVIIDLAGIALPSTPSFGSAFELFSTPVNPFVSGDTLITNFSFAKARR